MDEEMRFYGSFSVHLQSDGSENRMGFKIYFNGEEFRKSVVEPTGLSKINCLKNFKKCIFFFELNIFLFKETPAEEIEQVEDDENKIDLENRSPLPNVTDEEPHCSLKDKKYEIGTRLAPECKTGFKVSSTLEIWKVLQKYIHSSKIQNLTGSITCADGGFWAPSAYVCEGLYENRRQKLKYDISRKMFSSQYFVTDK